MFKKKDIKIGKPGASGTRAIDFKTSGLMVSAYPKSGMVEIALWFIDVKIGYIGHNTPRLDCRITTPINWSKNSEAKEIILGFVNNALYTNKGRVMELIFE